MWIKTLSTIQAIRLKEDIFRKSHPVCLSHDQLLDYGPPRVVRGRQWMFIVRLRSISIHVEKVK